MNGVGDDFVEFIESHPANTDSNAKDATHLPWHSFWNFTS